MKDAEILAISPFFIVRHVPSALAFYRDRLGFEITFQGPDPDDIWCQGYAGTPRNPAWETRCKR